MSSATSIGLSANSWFGCGVRMPPSCFPVSVSYSYCLDSSKFCHYIRRASSEGKIYNSIIWGIVPFFKSTSIMSTLLPTSDVKFLLFLSMSWWSFWAYLSNFYK